VGGNLSATLDALTLAGTSQVLPLRYGVPLFEFRTDPWHSASATPLWARGFVTAPWARSHVTPPFPPRRFITPAWTRAWRT